MADNQHYVIDDGQNKIPGYTKTEVDELIESGAKAWSGTQAEYNALKQAGLLQPRSLYIITDAANLNGTSDDLSYYGGTKTTYEEIEDIKTATSGTVTPSTNISILRYSLKKQNGVKYFNMIFQRSGTTTGIATIPVGFAPVENIDFPIVFDSGEVCRGRIQAGTTNIQYFGQFPNEQYGTFAIAYI